MSASAAITASFWMAYHAGGGPGVPWGLCALVARDIAADVEEAVPVGGWVTLRDGGSYQHWWCELPDGTVIDPMTEATYPDDEPRYSPSDDTDLDGSCLMAEHTKRTYGWSDAPCQCPDCAAPSPTHRGA